MEMEINAWLSGKRGKRKLAPGVDESIEKQNPEPAERELLGLGGAIYITLEKMNIKESCRGAGRFITRRILISQWRCTQLTSRSPIP